MSLTAALLSVPVWALTPWLVFPTPHAAAGTRPDSLERRRRSAHRRTVLGPSRPLSPEPNSWRKKKYDKIIPVSAALFVIFTASQKWATLTEPNPQLKGHFPYQLQSFLALLKTLLCWPQSCRPRIRNQPRNSPRPQPELGRFRHR